MSAYTMRFLACDADCENVFKGRTATGTSEGTTEIRKRARAAGWTHPTGWTDLCPDHSRKMTKGGPDGVPGRPGQPSS